MITLSMIEIRTLSNHRDVLGEGPQWLGGEQGLQRVDIRGRRIHRHDPVTGTAASRALDDDVGFALPAVSVASTWCPPRCAPPRPPSRR